MSSWMGKHLLKKVRGKKRGCITLGRRVKNLRKCLRGLLGHVEKKNREVKAQLELNLATSVKDNKNIFINTQMAKGRVRTTSTLY